MRSVLDVVKAKRLMACVALVLVLAALCNAATASDGVNPEVCVTPTAHQLVTLRVEELEASLVEVQRDADVQRKTDSAMVQALQADLRLAQEEQAHIARVNSECVAAREEEVKRAAACEKLKTAAEEDLKSKTRVCEQKQAELQASLQAVETQAAQCQKQLQQNVSSDEVQACKSEVQDLKAAVLKAGRDITEKESAAEKELAPLRATLEESQKEAQKAKQQTLQLKEEVTALRADYKTVEQRLQDAQRQLEQTRQQFGEAQKRLQEVQKEEALYSYKQFEMSIKKLTKLYTTAFLLFKTHLLQKEWIPESAVDDAMYYYEQFRLEFQGLVRQVQPQYKHFAEVARPYVIFVQQTYATLEPFFQDALQRISSAVADQPWWKKALASAQESLHVAKSWTETNVSHPLSTHPAFDSLIPSTPMDQIFALAYVFITFLLAFKVARPIVCALLRFTICIALFLFLLPFRCLKRFFQLCWLLIRTTFGIRRKNIATAGSSKGSSFLATGQGQHQGNSARAKRRKGAQNSTGGGVYRKEDSDALNTMSTSTERKSTKQTPPYIKKEVV